MIVKIKLITTSKSNELLESISKIKEYDKGNKMLFEISKCNTTSNETKEIYRYENENLLEKKILFNEELIQQTKLSYNHKHILIKEITTTFDGNEIYKFKRKNNKATRLIKDESGYILENKEIHYNSDNLIIKEIEDEGEYVTNYFYDNKNLIKVEVVENGKITLLETYKYNKFNNKIMSDGTDFSTGIRTIIEKTYDTFNNLKKETLKLDNEIDSISKYEYDNQNRLLLKIFNSKEEEKSITYEYYE